MMMRKLCPLVAMSALLVLPVYGQEKDHAAGEETKGSNAVPAKAAENAPAANSTKAAPGLFAMPAAPRATPFPAAAGRSQEGAPGRLTPPSEVAGGHSLR